MRLIVGMTGATGAPLGVELLQALRAIPDVETHLVMSKWAKTTIELETPWQIIVIARPIRRRPFPPAHFVPTA